jgi:hypothetical protein
LFALAVLALFVRPVSAAPVYFAAPVSISQTNLIITPIGGGLNQWDTVLNVTNTSASTIYNVSFVQTFAEVSDDGGSTFFDPSWNNTSQEWVLSSPYDATVSVDNAAFGLTQGQTTVAFPASLVGDSLPVVDVAGLLLPDQTVSFNLDNDLTSNVDVYFLNGAFLDTATPEPGTLSLLLLGGCAAAGFAFRQRKRASAAVMPLSAA